MLNIYGFVFMWQTYNVCHVQYLCDTHCIYIHVYPILYIISGDTHTLYVTYNIATISHTYNIGTISHIYNIHTHNIGWANTITGNIGWAIMQFKLNYITKYVFKSELQLDTFIFSIIRITMIGRLECLIRFLFINFWHTHIYVSTYN